ncbi:MAG: hypothetical protein QG608_647, partial [Actinomycetota bacterium]|nr:hypothetical protein [Actinomycetota bacterium]
MVTVSDKTTVADQDWLVRRIDGILRAAERLPRPTTRALMVFRPFRGDGPGWYSATGELSPSQVEALPRATLAQGEGERARLFDVLESRIDDEQILLRASSCAPREPLTLRVPTRNHRQELEGIARGLRNHRCNPLLAHFVRQSLSTLPTPNDRLPLSGNVNRDGQPCGWSALLPAQRRAVVACCSEGLHMVWGPPGTGKTHVIATAIAHLTAHGQRVLLVSNTNIAVDNALQQALTRMPDGCGAAIRVGTIHLPQLARQEEVNLDKLVEARQSTRRKRIEQLQNRMFELVLANESMAQKQKLLVGFDVPAYRRAVKRIDRSARHEQTLQAADRADADRAGAAQDLNRYEQEYLSLDCWRAKKIRNSILTDLHRTEEALENHLASPWCSRMLHRSAVTRLRQTRTALLDRLLRAEQTWKTAVEVARRKGADPDPVPAPVSALIDAGLKDARQRLREAEKRRKSSRRDIERMTAAGLATPEDQVLVSDEASLWDLHRRLPELQKQVEARQQERARLKQQCDTEESQLNKERQIIEKEIVSNASVVATTLTQTALRQWMTEVPFDHVIIDEAAAAGLHQVMHAVGCAKTGAVLVGDYLQNGPIVENKERLDRHTAELFATGCFTFFKITDPRQASNVPGCVVLTDQFRFGPALTELANRVAYRNVLRTAGRNESELVVVTVDGLPETLRTVYRSGKSAGWWVIGTLLARALAEHHQDGGAQDAFGVVVPYRAQQESTREAFQDSSLAKLTPVGTAHSFQGRQFDTVLADLVEDGQGWMAQAGLNGTDFGIGGVRVFNVAATRPRSRLYVLLSLGALRRAAGGPLAALRTMIDEGRATHIDAAALLGLSSREAVPEESIEAELLAALDPYVRVAGMYDEDAAIDEVRDRIERAERTIWCWCAWTGRYADGLVQALERAHHRGVEVHVMTRPPHQVTDKNRETLDGVTARLPRIVHIRDMHQKIVVVDRQWSVMGSMNMLSHGPTSSKRLRDIMITMDSARFAERLLHH